MSDTFIAEKESIQSTDEEPFFKLQMKLTQAFEDENANDATSS
jgi:hypothetical protein